MGKYKELYVEQNYNQEWLDDYTQHLAGDKEEVTVGEMLLPRCTIIDNSEVKCPVVESVKKCECGSESSNLPTHSIWCCKFEENQ